MYWLTPAVTAIKKIQIHGWFGKWLREVRFKSKPPLNESSSAGALAIQIRPSPGCVHQCTCFKLTRRGPDAKWTQTSNALHRNLLSGIHAGIHRCAPERSIELQPSDADRRGIYGGLQDAAIEKDTSAWNADGFSQDDLLIKKTVE